MIIINRLIKLKDKYPPLIIQELFSLFIAKNLPLNIPELTINLPNVIISSEQIVKELEIINYFFNVSFHAPKKSKQLYDIFKEIPICSAIDFDQQVEEIFDNLLCFPTKNLTGTFYTPKVVADLLVTETLREVPTSDRTYLDPACGAGIFLKACLKKFPGNSDQKLAFIKSSLFGCDINSQALEVSTFLLQVEALKSLPIVNLNEPLPDLRPNFTCQNSLITKFPQKFDYIFCNPPFGLSRNQQIEEIELQMLVTLNNWLFTGKLNKYLLFIIKCFQLLKVYGGTLGILTPNAWLGIRDGESLRRFLVRERGLIKILCFEKKIFPKLGVETIISVISKRPAESVAIKMYTRECGFLRSKNLDYQIIIKSKNTLIPTNWEPSFSELFEKLQSTTTPLASYPLKLTPTIAMQVYSLGRGNPPQSAETVKENSFHSEMIKSRNSYPYLNGKDLNSFEINWSGQYLDYGPWVAEFQDLSRYNSSRLVIREVLGKPPYMIKAAIVTETFLYNRSILHLHSDDSKILPLMAAIFNSQFASFYFLIKGRKANRKIFPKIVLDDLKDFPIPNNLNFNSKKLAKLLQNPLTTLNRSLLDKLVYKQYSLGPEQIKIIENILEEWKATF